MTELARICSRRAELLRELAELEESLGRAVSETLCPEPTVDETFSLAEAAALMGERPETFRRRFEYRKALLTRPNERRLRYSRDALERIKRDRLASNSVAR
jgi:chromatin segregation and condensation protein Rec8/ScpA/Scc1 (kleisin family)